MGHYLRDWHSWCPTTIEREAKLNMTRVSDFIDRHFRHFNAAALRDAAMGYGTHIDSGGKMFLAMAGAMSTAELGRSLAEMIRAGKVHAISCTGANLEEDIFNLVAHDKYERIPHYRDLTPADDKALLDRGLNRVTDTCIPEGAAVETIEYLILELWQRAEKNGERFFPHEFIYQLIREGMLDEHHKIDPKDSWLIAACEMNLPIFVPGWEDSTLGNIYVAYTLTNDLKTSTIRGGLEYMEELCRWYRNECESSIGFFQIGGGIAGDFPICSVPLIRQDLEEDVPLWGYFAQISDSTTSYGSYSGAPPSEKISWEKIDVNTPSYIIESDATICAPLIFAYVLGW